VGQLPQLNDFVLTVVADVGALVALLRANQLFAYVLRGPEEGVVQVESVEVGGKNTNVRRLNKVKLDTMYGLYFFRNAQVKNDDLEGSDTLQLAAAFCNTNNEELFFTGFVWALKECLKDMGGNTRMMMVDDIGHAQRLRKRWSMKNSTVFECECAYYVCNYVVPRSPLNTSTSFLLL
jgi:hypothetical protein